jgi:hypothetical protein
VVRSQPADLVGIQRSHRGLRDAHVAQGQLGEKIVGIAIARPQSIELEAGASLGGNGRVAALAVGDRDADGTRSRPRECDAAEPSRRRHHLPSVGRTEAISFHVVSLAPSDGRDQRGQIDWVHLAIARHHYECVTRPARARQGALVSGRYGRADATVLMVMDDFDSPVACRARHFCGTVATRVIDHDDRVHP